MACVWLPQFAVRVERERRPDLAGAPLALVGRREGGEGEALVVRACSLEAAAAGLAVGGPAHTISQRCPHAVIMSFDAHAYRQRYETLLTALDALTPLIEIQPPEVFYLDLSGLVGMDAEHPEQVADAVREVIPERFSPHVGVASGKFTAWVAASLASPVRPLGVTDAAREIFLKEAPSSLLPVEPEMARRLHLMGLRTLGKIARLPRSALLAQFGWPGERAHRLACGEDREPLTPHAPPPVIRESMVFPMPAPTTAHFNLALAQLLERVCRRPERRNRAVRQLRLEAVMEGGEVWERTVTLRQPSEQWDQIFAELRRRLESARPAGALTELTLELTALTTYVDTQRKLFPDEKQRRQDRLAYELGQLRERMGGMPVCRIVEVEPWSRLPEKRHALLSCDT
ncbi:MAG: DNA-directed polymerase [Armatimonadetes bacterium]|nr:DNA-directed polymerase [Armatimonadota bacterium]